MLACGGAVQARFEAAMDEGSKSARALGALSGASITKTAAYPTVNHNEEKRYPGAQEVKMELMAFRDERRPKPCVYTVLGTSPTAVADFTQTHALLHGAERSKGRRASVQEKLTALLSAQLCYRVYR